MFRTALALLLAVVIAGCGGGGSDAGTSTFGSGGSGGGSGGSASSTPSAADLVLSLSANSIANNGTQTVVASAVAIDGNRNTVTGVPVTVSVDSGGIVTPAGTKTDANGTLSATVGIGSDHTNRTLTVTAKTGNLTRTASLQVVDSASAGGSAPSDLLLTLSSSTIANDGKQSVTVNAIALDAKRNVLPGIVVSLSVDNGATLTPLSTVTGSNGVLSGTVDIGADHTNRTLTITATAAGLTARTAQLLVVDAPTTATPTAADLNLGLSSSTLDNGGTNTVTVTATAVDSKRNALAGIPVTFTVDGNAVAVVNAATTDTNGTVKATVGIGSDRTNRTINVTATSGTITRTTSFLVVGAALTASLAPAVDAGSSGNQIEYKLADTNGLPMAGQPISVSSPSLPSASGTTDSNGKYTYTYQAPATPGTLTIVASAGGDTNQQSVTLLPVGGGGVPNASSLPQSASLTPTPSVVSVNTAGSNSNQVELRALFLGANNQPIPNIRVRFDLAGNANSSDGQTSQPGTYAYSDATGVARGTFTPGQISSPTNGITVRACYDVGDFATTTCPHSVSNTLTVASEALSVNIRTDNTVDPTGAGGLTYIKKFVVMVVDAAGQAKSGVLITPSVDLPAYYKGYYSWNGKVWAQTTTLAGTENWQYDTASTSWQRLAATSQPACPNEDVNRNGVREAPAYDASATAPAVSARQEDLNWNGDLDPRKADVAVRMVGSATTDENGVAIVQIEYGKNLASWVDFIVTVTASGISGTEARARYSGLLYGLGNLPYLADDVTKETVPPAFVVSPYGSGTVCTDSK